MAKIVKTLSGRPPEVLYTQIVKDDTLYVGQIVECQGNEGAAPIGAGAGAADTTGKVVPFGIVTGFNLMNPTFDTTYMVNKGLEASPHGSTVEYFGSPTGDGALYARIELITPDTVVEAPIYASTYGTAVKVGTVTTASTTGLGTTCSAGACDVAGVASLATVYMRTGANAGTYRVTDDTSTTALTWDSPTKYDVAVGDTLVRVNGLRPIGPSYAQFDSESIFIDAAAALTTDYYVINVLKLDLSTAGKEHVHFTFGLDHFCLKRA